MIDAGTVMGFIVGTILGTLLNTLAIWIVGKLGLGITIKNLGTAFLAGLLTAVLGLIIFHWTDAFTMESGSAWLGHLLHLIVTAIILIIVARLLPGMQTKGFVGAIVAAIAIALVFFLMNQLALVVS